MKKIVLLLTFLLTACDNQQQQQGDNATLSKLPELQRIETGTIAVGSFLLSGSAATGQYAPSLSRLKRFIDSSLVSTSGFTVLEKDRLGALQDEQQARQLVNSGETDNVLASSVPLPLADYVLIGEMDEFSLDIQRGAGIGGQDQRAIERKIQASQYIVRSSVEMRLIEVATRKRIFSHRELIAQPLENSGSSADMVNQALQVIAQKIVANTLQSLAGDIRIADVSDNRLMLNRGRRHGLQQGIDLLVYKAGRKVADPETGELLDLQRIRLGKARIDEVKDKIAFARLLDVSDLPTAGDLVVIDRKRGQQLANNALGRQKIRLALTDLIWMPQVHLQPAEQQTFDYQLSSSLAAKIADDPAFSIASNQIEVIKPLITQQMLSGLQQNREINLPMGSIRGVDYLVFGNISQISISAEQSKQTTVPFTGEVLTKHSAAQGIMRGDLYIQNVHTNESVVRVLVEAKQDFSVGSSLHAQQLQLAEEYAAEAWKQVLLRLRPVEVAAVTGNYITLNSGADTGIQIGQQWQLFAPGQLKTDAHTGARLDIGAVPVADMTITGFDPHGFAQGTAVSSQRLKTGYLAKPKEVQDSLASSPVQSSGVAHTLKAQATPRKQSTQESKPQTVRKVAMISPVRFAQHLSQYKQKSLQQLDIKSQLEQAISNTQIYDLVTRDQGEFSQLIQEKQLAQTQFAKNTYQTDYTVEVAAYDIQPEVIEFTAYSHFEKLELIEYYERSDVVEIKLKVTPVSNESYIQPIIRSGRASLKRESATRSKHAAPSTALMQTAVSKAVQAISNALVDEQAPILVMDVNGDTVVINRAKGSLKVGELLDVYSENKTFKDPNTNKEILYEGRHIGKAKVIRIHEHYAEAKIIDGDAVNIRPMFTLRKIN